LSPPENKRIEYKDNKIPELRFRVTPTGVKSFPVFTDSSSGNILLKNRVCDEEYNLVKLNDLFDSDNDIYKKYCIGETEYCEDIYSDIPYNQN